MLIMIKLSSKLWTMVLCPIWSFFVNISYYIIYLKDYKKVQKLKKELLNQSLKEVMNRFKWKADNFKDWTPWIYVMLARDLKDDCDGAAVLAKWYLKEKGIDSNRISLMDFTTKKGHAILVTSSRDLMVSNNTVYDINPDNWKQEVLNKFKTTYEIFHIH